MKRDAVRAVRSVAVDSSETNEALDEGAKGFEVCVLVGVASEASSKGLGAFAAEEAAPSESPSSASPTRAKPPPSPLLGCPLAGSAASSPSPLSMLSFRLARRPATPSSSCIASAAPARPSSKSVTSSAPVPAPPGRRRLPARRSVEVRRTSAVGERGAGGAGRAGMTSLVERRSEARRLASARDHFARFCVAETLSEGVCRETREQPRWTHLLDPALLYRLDVVVVLVGPHVQHDIPTRAAHMRIVRLDGTLLAFVPRPDRRRARPHAQVASLLLVSVRSVRLLPACGVGRWCVRACSWLWIGLQGRVVWLGYGEREWRGGGRWGRSTREREGPRGRRPRQG